MSGRDGVKANLQENDVCVDQASDEEGEKGSDFVEESSQNECEKKEEKRQAQTPVKKTVWVLVFDLEENKHSPPILLEEVQDKSGRNGEEAGLKKHDKARYKEGGKLQEAFIVSLSENEEDLDEKYKKMVELMKQAQEESNGNLWHYTKVIGGGIVAGSLAVAAAPLVLSAVGFGASGIAAGSVAAQWMSWSVGGVVSGSLFSTLQSAGMAGISTATNLLIGTAAGTAGGAVTKKLSDSEKPGSSEEAENQCKICLDGKMDTRLDPCGHLLTCRSCARMLQVCPICRKPIQK